MSVATQALVPANSSVADFLAEVGTITRECERTRPSKLSFRALERWRQDKNRQIVQITKQYAGNNQNALALSNNEGISPVDTETLEEASGHIIKVTCAAKKATKNTIKIEDFRIFNFDKKSYLTISFVKKDSRGVIKISPAYGINFDDISIFTDVPTDKPVWLIGERGNGPWLKNVEFHVHSEDDMRFLFG